MISWVNLEVGRNVIGGGERKGVDSQLVFFPKWRK